MNDHCIDFKVDELDWEKTSNLMPAIIQDAKSLQVLMLGFMNKQALQSTIETGKVTFFSRTKQRLWQKGETSGNILNLVSIKTDCDKDTLLIKVNSVGPTCHLGNKSCFGEESAPDLGFIAELEQVISGRAEDYSDKSYTSSLFKKGTTRIAQKVGEEGVEVAIAAVTGDEKLKEEAADLIYHLLVLLKDRGLSMQDVIDVLSERSKAGSK